MTDSHRTTREGDETVCSCGLRWGVDESDPHNVQPVKSIHTMAQVARSLRSRHGLKRRGIK